jgi:hypothetical protein
MLNSEVGVLPGQTATEDILRGMLKSVDSKLLKVVYGHYMLSISKN